jgi:hypothetical protein
MIAIALTLDRMATGAPVEMQVQDGPLVLT